MNLFISVAANKRTRALLLPTPTEEAGRSLGGAPSEKIQFCFIILIWWQTKPRKTKKNKNKTGFTCEKEVWETVKTRENGKNTTHNISGLLGLLEALEQKYSLYNIKLVGESAHAKFPEYLKKLIQDRGYWSRFLKIKTGLFKKWIPSRDQNFHLCFKNRLNAIFIVSPNFLLSMRLWSWQLHFSWP